MAEHLDNVKRDRDSWRRIAERLEGEKQDAAIETDRLNAVLDEANERLAGIEPKVESLVDELAAARTEIGEKPVPWVHDGEMRPCTEAVEVRAADYGMYGASEVELDCEGIADHDGPHFVLDLDGYTVTFKKEAPDGI